MGRSESGKEHRKRSNLVCVAEGLNFFVKLVIEGEMIDLRLARGDSRSGLVAEQLGRLASLKLL